MHAAYARELGVISDMRRGSTAINRCPTGRPLLRMQPDGSWCFHPRPDYRLHRLVFALLGGRGLRARCGAALARAHRGVVEPVRRAG